MRDFLLYVAGWLSMTTALVHSWVGETDVFARVRIEPERLRSLIRLIWHCSAVAWAGIGILLSAAPKMGSQARASIIGSAIGIYGFAAIANAWGTRGKHFGWLALLVIVG